jgi:hypothetical protein
VCVRTNARARGASAGKASLAAAARGAAGAQRVRVALRRARYKTHAEAMTSAGIYTQRHTETYGHCVHWQTWLPTVMVPTVPALHRHAVMAELPVDAVFVPAGQEAQALIEDAPCWPL